MTDGDDRDDDAEEIGGDVIPLPEKPIELRPKTDLPFRLVVNNTGKYCRHPTKLVDDNHRTVECKQCGASLDAFSVLAEVAHEHRQFEGSLERLRVEVRACEGRLKLLNSLENKARARARRLGIRGSKHHYDRLLDYVRKRLTSSRFPLTEADVDRIIHGYDPPDRIKAGLEAIEAGELFPGIELVRRAVDDLDASLEVVREEEERANG